LLGALDQLVSRAFRFAREVASSGDQSAMRRAASGLYNVTSAVVLACEGSRLGETQGDWSRAVLAGLVVRHKLLAPDPLADFRPADFGLAEAIITGSRTTSAELRAYWE
jgi:hypothetical protein